MRVTFCEETKTTLAKKRDCKRFPMVLSMLIEAETERKVRQVRRVKRGQEEEKSESTTVSRHKNLFRELKKFCLACKSRSSLKFQIYFYLLKFLIEKKVFAAVEIDGSHPRGNGFESCH